QTFVPTDAQRTGDFSNLRTSLRNPIDALTGQPFTDASGRPCVTANVITPGCISPAAQTVLERFIPRSPDGTYVSFNPQPSNNYSLMSRIDFLQSSKHNMYGHYYQDHYVRSFANGDIRPFVSGTR